MIVLNPRDWVTLEKPDKGKNHDQIKGGNGALETNAIQLQRKEDNHILHHWVGLYISNPCVVSIESLQFSQEVVTPGLLCYKEEPILTPRWLYFFYFNLCFLLLLFGKRILSTCNGLPQGTLHLCLNVKPKCLCSGPCPSVDGHRKEEINTSPPWGWPFRE